MKRITKKPAERKQELVNAAERLFLEKGYERTAVGDIVRSISVAQGTFYYHFSSKTSILEAVLEKNFSEMERALTSIIERTDIDAIEQFSKMVNRLFRFSREKKGLVDAAHLASNAVLHQKLEEMSHTKLIPLVTKVVEAGVAEGQFDVPFPTETIDLIFHAVMHIIQEPAILSDRSRRKRVRLVLERFLVSALGMRNNSISLKL
jgi:AcrR family transcriptional regulator